MVYLSGESILSEDESRCNELTVRRMLGGVE